MKLEVGKYYVARNGDIFGPMVATSWGELATCEPECHLWNISNGTHGDGDCHWQSVENYPLFDLITEYSPSMGF